MSDSAKAADPNRTLLLPSGGHYVGDVDRERQHGRGTEFHSNGSAAASGEWRDGKLHGFGVKWNADRGLQQCGRFEDGELVESRTVPLVKLPAGDLHNGNQRGQRLTERLRPIASSVPGRFIC